MIFSKNVFILLLVLATGALQELNAMESESEEEITVVWPTFEQETELDFQIYQLLSEATKNNPQVYLPEIMHIVVTNLCDITEHYGKYGSCLEHPEYFIKFIQGCLEKSISLDRIVTVLKMRLRYSGTSLSKIQDNDGSTVFHFMDKIERDYRVNCTEIICLVAGDKAWDLIKMQDNFGLTVLHYYYSSTVPFINKLLSVAPNPEEQWKFICTKTDKDMTALHFSAQRPSNIGKTMIKKLLTYAPDREQAWSSSRKTRKFLESYRPANL